MILVALSDPRPLEAVSTVLRRLAYLVMPLSIVLHKYYPAMGRQYDVWSGQVSYVGATTSKNMLGILCMVSGLFFLWDTLTRWHGRKDPGSRRVLLVNGGFLLMTLWLLSLADSATSTVCLVLGCVILVSAHGQIGPLRRRVAAVLIPAGVCLGLVLSLAFWGAVGGQLAPLLGRDATLTDRTEIWQVLAAMQTNPMIGSGYESFWLGSRLEQVWGHGFLINQAHNGYLQVYLNLGAIGLSLLIGVMAAAYRKISTGLSGLAAGCSFALAVWVVLVVYNVTEAAFLGGLLWSTLLLFMGPFTEPCTAPVGAQEPAKGIRPTWRRPKTVAPARAVQRPFTARTAPSKAQSSAAARPGRLIRLQDRFRTSKNVTPTRGSLGRRR
jgi:O-antigen ligase